ncbi:MAG: FecR domain-containing protein [Betaproteobacteria bacterium]|nr:FecR domain-containing protein [Betaproteobacteria bacterium]
MRRCFGFAWCVVFFLAWGLPVFAEPRSGDAYAVADGVQMPAWVERGGKRQPLAPGQSLQNRDKVLTGGGARVAIRLADGSTVKLGENAELRLNALGRREDRVFTGALEVTRGAFRLTSGALPYQRAFNVRMAALTAGVRSADLWGNADDKGDLLCVLDGQVMALHAKEEARFLSEPYSCYFAAKGSAMPKVLDDVDAEQVRSSVSQIETHTTPLSGQGDAPAPGARIGKTL